MSGQAYRYKEVEIENFLVFKGNDNKIIFPENKLITVLNGENTAGKTSLLKFFYWMLFSDNKIDSSFNIIQQLIPTKPQSTNPLSYLNHLTKKEDFDECKVGGKLTLDIKSKKSKKDGEYEISKYLIFKKKSSGKIEPVNLEIKVIDPDYITLNESEINDFFMDVASDFPLEIRNFIFIPSETLGNLFTETYYDQIREFSIHRSELPFLDKIYNLVDLFVMLCDYYIKQEENKTDKLEKLNKDIEDFNEEIDEKRDKISEVNAIKVEFENQLQNIENEILALFKNKEMRDEWIRINKERKGLEDNLDRKSNDLSEFLKKNAVKIYLFVEMCEIQKDLGLKKDFPHFFDKNIALTIINDIENRKLKDCPICGTSIQKDEAIRNLEEYIERLINKEGADTEIAIKFKTKLKNEIKMLSVEMSKLIKLYDEMESIKKSLKDAEQEERSLSSKLSEEEKSEDYSKRYETLVKQKRIKEQLIKSNKGKIDKFLLEIEKKEGEIRKLSSKKESIKTGRKKISRDEGKWKEIKDTFIKVRKVLDSLIRPNYEETIKKNILKNTKDVCQYIFDIEYDSFIIEINEERLLSAGKKLGWRIEFDKDLYDKSNGQETILIISYIISIFNTLDLKIPLFLDGPFSVLDTPFSARLADILSKLGQKQQFIITLLNKILTEEVKMNLKEDKCNKYSLIPEVKLYKSKIENLTQWD